MNEVGEISVEMPSENGIEHDILDWLRELGWETYGTDETWGAPELDAEYDRKLSEVVYWDILEEQVLELNDNMTEDEVGRFLGALRKELSSERLVESNQQFTELLRKGKKHSYRDDIETEYVTLVNFEELEANRWIAANQFRVHRKHSIRTDIVCFLNGLPIVVWELKTKTSGNTYSDGIRELLEYQEKVPRLFVPTIFNVAADGLDFRCGAIGASEEHYNPWKTDETSPVNEVKEAVFSLFQHEVLANLLDRYVFFEEGADGDVKIVPRYMQYYGTEEILQRAEDPDKESGLVWHTQGSGKSYTMVFAAWNLLERGFLRNPQVLIVVDTDKLRTQMQNTLSNIDFPRFEVADNMDHLQQLLEEGSSKLVLTTIQMFQDVEAEVQTNDETVVFVDEAHRFMEKDLGISLHAAIPDAQHFGLTGTPVRQDERDTFENYSPEEEEYLHRYSIKDGIEDDVVLPVRFDVRPQEWQIDEEELDLDFQESFSELDIDQRREIVRKHVNRSDLAELRSRVEVITEDIVEHYENKLEPNNWKGMVVTPSRRAAALYGEELETLCDPEEVEVLVTSDGGDEELIEKYHTTNEERESIVQRFKKPEEYPEDPKILVVCDMLLTGFDAPILKTMYLDRNLKNHNLLQAIARTNRPAEGKVNGEIVDYAGVFENMDDALDYDPKTRDYAAQNVDELLEDFKELLERTMNIFEDVEQLDSQELINRAVAVANENRAKFEANYSRLEDMYESISPDPRLKTRGLREQYLWLGKIHLAHQRSRRHERPEEEASAKTRELIEEHVDVTDIKENTPIYGISEKHLEMVQSMDPKAKATEIAHATQDYVRGETTDNPEYDRISQRVDDLVSRWRSGGMEPPEVAERLEEAERELLTVDEERRQSGMSDAEYAVYCRFREEPDVRETEGKDFASDIDTGFQEIDTDFDGWDTKRKKRKEIRRMVVQILVAEHDRRDLYEEEGLIDDIVFYLINNEKSEES